MFPKRSSNNRSIALLLGDDLGWFPEMDALHQYLFLNKGNIVLLLDMPIDTQRPFVREHFSQVFCRSPLIVSAHAPLFLQLPLQQRTQQFQSLVLRAFSTHRPTSAGLKLAPNL